MKKGNAVFYFFFVLVKFHLKSDVKNKLMNQESRAGQQP